jgi:N-acetylglucosamine kinase
LPLTRAGEGPITLAAGSRDEHGVVLVAGTGSLSWARNREGRTHFASGWGSLLGDEGSAHDIAQAGLRAACRASDGRGPETSLLERYLALFGVDSLRQIVPRVYGGDLDRRAIAATCPVVFEAARAGDAVARRILRRAARELALSAATCIRILEMERDRFDVVASGGVFHASDFVFPEVARLVQRRSAGARMVRPRYEPAVGAALLSLQALGVPLDDEAYARLDSSVHEVGLLSPDCAPQAVRDSPTDVSERSSEAMP